MMTNLATDTIKSCSEDDTLKINTLKKSELHGGNEEKKIDLSK